MNLKTHNFFLNRCKWIVAILLCGQTIFSQQTYFQQEVNYTITVSLNDKKHSLSAFENIQYINNSDKGIEFIYFHLWPNAYKNNNTALGKQLVRLGKSDLYFSKEEERGYIDSLDFKVDGKAVKVEYDKENIDICKIILNVPLKSLDTLQITTPFHVKIPDAKFSRMGHVEQAYFITQWYPKPAVYDKDGWHPMPYLDQGEFFSEFGSFDVSITLPENYLLSATGDRVNAAEEENFLNNNVAKTIERWEKNDYRANEMAFPPSSTKFKTVRFRQYRVHDFAWFADKRFNVLHDQFELPNSKRIVDSWIFFTNKNFELWKEAINYVNESAIFYSYLIGDYPYNHVTAVDGTIMAGGGMEYPNITVIGQMSSRVDLDITIAHEVGHNWFYGMLASNERDNPALDEGLNSLYEMRYCRAKYPRLKLTQYLNQDSTFKLFGIHKLPYWKEKEVGFLYSAKAGSDQAININSDDFTPFNYGSIVYAKTAVALDYLMNFMGEGTFDKAMQFYFDQFKFKHPTISDLEQTLNHFNGSEMNWFFKNLMQSTDKIDYKIKSISRLKDGSFDFKIKNKTNVAAPFNIYAYKKNKVAGFVWSNGFTNTKKISFPAIDADYFRIDGLEMIPEINRKNNGIRTSGIFKKAKSLQLNFLSAIENPKKHQINYLPLVGGNFYNGLMAGIALHNYGLYEKKFEYALSPMFGFKSMSPTGFAEFNYNIHPKKLFQKIVFGTKSKLFAYNIYDAGPYNALTNSNYKSLNLQYLKIAPYISFELKKAKPNNNIHQFITYTSNNLFTETEDTDTSTYRTFITDGPKKKEFNYYVNELAYEFSYKSVINPYNFRFALEHNDKMAKLSACFNYQFSLSKTHDISIRASAGTFVFGNDINKGMYAFRAAGYNGYHDYAFNDNFVARNESHGLGFSQFSERDGAIKVWTPLGQTTQWLAAINIKSPKLFILPVKIFVDVATCDGRSLNNDKFLWATGANITLWKDIIDIYIPVSYNKDIQTTLELNNIEFWNRIRFTLNLHKLVPRNFIKDYLF